MNLHSFSLPLFTIPLKWFGEKVPKEKSISFFQKMTIPPPLVSQQNSIIPPKFNLILISSSLAISSHVSAKNTTEGSCALIKSPSSYSVSRFPSLRQFQHRRFIAFGGAAQHPPPLKIFSDCFEQPTFFSLEPHSCQPPS